MTLDPSSTDPSAYGQQVTFDAQVRVIGGGPVTPTGTVLFYDGDPAAGGTPIGVSQVLVGGQASITTAGLSVRYPRDLRGLHARFRQLHRQHVMPLSQTVIPATPTITWASPAPITYGTPLGPAQLDATASVPGSFAYTPAAGVVLHAGNNQTLSVTFTPTDHIDYTIATAMTTISVNQATPSITWASPAPITYGTALGPAQLDATASVPGSFAYTPAAGVVLHAGNNQTLSVDLHTHRSDRLHVATAIDHDQRQSGHALDHLGQPRSDHLRHAARPRPARRHRLGARLICLLASRRCCPSRRQQPDALRRSSRPPIRSTTRSPPR